MTELQRQAYSNMKSTGRVLLWMVKCQELMELSQIMTKEDVKEIKKCCDLMEGKQ